MAKTYTFNCKVCGAEKSILLRYKRQGRGVYCSNACIGVSKRKDASGQRFNNLTVLKRDEQKGENRWVCLCTCGKEVSVRLHHLQSNLVKSCGCLPKGSRKHGLSKSSIYHIWRAMIHRCTNPKNAYYEYYGERGITVCDRWKSIENFIEDMGERPPGLTLDRIDNDKGYSKDNCRWATRSQQGHNQRYLKKRNSKYKGVRKNGCKWVASIKVKKENYYLGTFQTEKQAAIAYNEAAKKYYGDLNDINKIED